MGNDVNLSKPEKASFLENVISRNWLIEHLSKGSPVYKTNRFGKIPLFKSVSNFASAGEISNRLTNRYQIPPL